MNLTSTLGGQFFILEKLKTADFKGAEFESFYFLWVKLSKMLEEK